MKNSFIKFNRNSSEYFRIIEERPTAFTLLSLIANRARRTNEKDLSIELEIGEALIGDYFSYNVTESVYRTDVKFLVKHGFIVKTRTNRRGTVVKLVNTDIFDICPQIFDQELTTNKRINYTREIKYTQDNITGDISPGSLIAQEIDSKDSNGGKE
ncbi:MAG: hypothetical protein NTY75_00260 [Candidatus Shapirobacteria bacterium]|nr:hypothetical protein [Candidatus Shapirobacteria bacterium]